MASMNNYLGLALLNQRRIGEFIINRRKIKRVVFNRRIVWEKIGDIPSEDYLNITPYTVYLNIDNQYKSTVNVDTNLTFDVNPI